MLAKSLLLLSPGGVSIGATNDRISDREQSRPDERHLPALSVVLPAYNEEPNLEAAVGRAFALGPHIGGELEVIVVDDGSQDGSRELLSELLQRHHPRLRVLEHPRNQGYGAALRTGFSAARGRLVFFTDADNQFDIDELRYFIPLMDEFDVAIGFRVYRYDTVVRSILSWVYNRLVGLLFRLRVRDVDCAFKLMRREVVEQVWLECDNFFVSTELIARARKWNFRIAQKGVRHYPRTAGVTTVHASDIPRTLREIARMWQRIYFPTPAQRARARTEEARRQAAAMERTPVSG
jgi:glycosyltransferase involved in cell wall biosynthesis